MGDAHYHHNHHGGHDHDESIPETTTTIKTVAATIASSFGSSSSLSTTMNPTTAEATEGTTVHQHYHYNTPHAHAEGHQMANYFHGGSKEVILFSFWQIESCFGLIMSFILIFLMGAFYEGIKWFRVYFDLWTTDAATKSFSGCLSMSAFSKAGFGKRQKPGVQDALIPERTLTPPITSGDNNGMAGGGCPCNNSGGFDSMAATAAAISPSNNTLAQEVYAPTVIISTTPAGAGTPINRWTWIMMYISREFSPGTCKLIETAIYALQLILAYWLMLIAMTFNIWLTSAVVLGAAFGHWLFANLKCAPPRRCFCSACCPNGNTGPEQLDNMASDACH